MELRNVPITSQVFVEVGVRGLVAATRVCVREVDRFSRVQDLFGAFHRVRLLVSRALGSFDAGGAVQFR